MNSIRCLLVACMLLTAHVYTGATDSPAVGGSSMNLGDFSLSLAVKDLAASRAFYEAFGFKAVPKTGEGGAWDAYEVSWVLMEHDGVQIGLFQGMFEENILTFNPPDVRGIQKKLKQAGISLKVEADESTTGPASAVVIDPDGNAILLDQHSH